MSIVLDWDDNLVQFCEFEIEAIKTFAKLIKAKPCKLRRLYHKKLKG